MQFIPLNELIFPKESFHSSSEVLNRYFYTQVSQDVKKRVASCFILVNDSQIIGYYTLSAASISLIDLPPVDQKKLPRYPTVPVVRLGRLALDQQFVGQGIGRFLLIDALKRVVNAEIAAYAIIVDAKDDNAVTFYKKYGFLPYSDNKKQLYLPLNQWVKSFLG